VNESVHILKLGGSLLDLPDLIARIEVVRRIEVTGSAAMIIGGGDAADVVRSFDQRYRIGETASHWLAVRAMQFNAHVVAAVLPDAVIAGDIEACRAAWAGGALVVIDPFEWLQVEERAGIVIPHRWTFTSDSIAAHLATRLGAQRLTLLKSTTNKEDTRDVLNYRFATDVRNEVFEAVSEGVVDADFEAASRAVPRIDVINLRDRSLERGEIAGCARRVLR